jgi:hypothetical protein
MDIIFSNWKLSIANYSNLQMARVAKSRTTEMSSVLRVIDDKNYAQSILAGERGFEPEIMFRQIHFK